MSKELIIVPTVVQSQKGSISLDLKLYTISEFKAACRQWKEMGFLTVDFSTAMPWTETPDIKNHIDLRLLS